MRLTLRTLLAYLDDILEPSQAREIGQKVQNAPLAKELVARIRDVVRRRRLGAPSLEGPDSGLDPNVVAEYLDNQLTPAQVAQTERILLNSEMHLAEAASAHQILTLVLGEPVEVLPESRKRMYALGPVQDDEKLLVEPEDTAGPVVETTDRLAVSESNGSSSSNGAAHADTGVELAEYVRDQQSNRRFWPLVGVAGLILAFLALQWTAPWKTGEKPAIATNDAASDESPANVGGAPTIADSSEVAEETAATESTEPTEPLASAQTDSSETSESSIPPEPVVAITEPTMIDAPAPADVPEAVDVKPPMDEPVADKTDVAVAGVEPTEKPNVTLLAPPGVGNDNADPAMPAAPPAPVVADKVEPAAKPPAITLTYKQEKNLLLRESIEEGWKMVADGASIGDGDRLAAPRPYVAHLVAEKLPVDFHLAAGSRMRMYSSPQAAIGLRLERGRVVISRRIDSEDDAAKKDPIAIRIAVGDERWTVTLPPSAARVAIDAAPIPPIRLEKVYDGFPFKVSAIGNEGVVIVASSKGEERNIGPEDRITLAGPKAGEVLVEPGHSNWLVSKDPVGQWVAGPRAPTDVRDAIRFAKEFDPENSMSDTMPALLQHERSWMARRAVQCLSLTQDYTALVHALAVPEHDEATAEAILGIREWLANDAENGEFLKAALDQEFTATDSQTIYQLLWGYDETHAHDLKASRELVRWLSSERPAIRRLAYFHILRLSGQQDEYRPSLTPDRLTTFRKRWERQIEKNGTILKD